MYFQPDTAIHIGPPDALPMGRSAMKMDTSLKVVPASDAIPVGAVLDNWSSDPWSNGVQIDRLEDMETLTVRTHKTLYEIIIIEGQTGEILVRGGQFFPELTPARLTGATLGGSFCKMRGIYVGFRMEFSALGQRIETTPVESIQGPA
jgi:hypothetical protein